MITEISPMMHCAKEKKSAEKVFFFYVRRSSGLCPETED